MTFFFSIAYISTNYARARPISQILSHILVLKLLTDVYPQAAMEAGFKDRIPCHTVTMACISSNMALSTGKYDMCVCVRVCVCARSCIIIRVLYRGRGLLYPPK